MSAAAQEEMFVAFAPPPMVGSDEEIFSLAAALALLETDNSKNTVKGEKPHQGVSSRKAALFLGPELCNSTTALGVSWCWWTGTALGAGDSYDYDAFGNLINSTGSTPNNYLFAGEQYDPTLNLYYNRARYYNTTTGRFWSMDTVEGNTHDPLSLHKYLYVANNAPNLADPSGQDFDLGSTLAAVGDALTIAGQAVVQFGTVLGNIYYTLGPALPLIVEKGFFYLAAGAVVTQVLAGAPDALRAIDNLANNIQSYNGQFSAGPGPRGIQVGRAAQQNLGDGFPVFDNFDPETGEGTQIYSTTQIQTTQQFIAAVRAKASQFQRGFDATDTFSGKDSAGNPFRFEKTQVTSRNMLVVTPANRNFPLSRVATELEQLEAEFGLEEIVVEESQGLAP